MMAETEENALEVQEKKELVEKEEKTIPARYYEPYTDIYETEDSLTLVMEMPGVEKDDIDVNINDDILQIEGRINLSKYTEMQPVHTEYNIGHYTRRFSLSSKIDQDNISANVNDGVLTLLLPKAEEAKPRKININ
jgi:HSP20 family molecular chaperone IbpA